MAWRLPLLNRTARSLEQASRKRTGSPAKEAARARYQRVRDLARKRLALAEEVIAKADAS